MKNNYVYAQFLVTLFIWIILSDSIYAQPKAECFSSVPDELIYDRNTRDFSPNPVPIRLVIKNTGDLPLQNGNATIIYYASDFDLVSPLLLTQQYTPSTILPGDSGVVQWNLSAKKKRGIRDTVEICIISSYDNSPTNTCCWKIIIPPTEPIIHCTKHILPKININAAKDGYDPMPFTFYSEYMNDGGCSSDSLFATIVLTPPLQLDTSEHNQAIKPLEPAVLRPGEHAAISWTLWHPPAFGRTEHIITLCVHEKNYDSICCERPLSIPSLAKTVLNCSHDAPSELARDTVHGIYTPNPFPVTIRIKNSGELAADSVRATIILPPDVIMNPSTQQSTRFFNPMQILKWRDGMYPNELTWNLELTKKPKTRKCYTIQYRIDGVNTSGQVDPCFGSFDVCVSPMIPQLMCDLEAPLSLVLNSQRTGVTPNPFSIRYVLRSIGTAPIGIRTTQLFIDSTTGVFILPSTPNPVTWNKELPPGDSIEAFWYCQVANSLKERIVRIEIYSIDEEGDPDQCAYNLFIPAVDSLLDVRRETPSAASFYLGQNYPNPFTGLTIIDCRWKIEQQERAIFKVYDVLGREILDLSKEVISNSSLVIHHSQLPGQGIYFYRLTIGNQSQTKMMMLIR